MSTTSVDPATKAAAPKPEPAPVSVADPSAEAVVIPDPLGAAINGFGLDLWGQLRERPGNLTISPASVHVALTMTWLGAKGATRDQLGSALHLDELPATADVAASTGALLDSWTGVPALTLLAANRLFGEQTFSFEAAYMSALASKLRAPLELVDFVGAVEPTRAHINAWVKDQTQARIVDLIPPGGVDAQTRLVLTNAIYFLADWRQPFEAKQTTSASFHAVGANTKVKMMHATHYYTYEESEEVQVVTLRYSAPGFAMTLVLPREGKQLAEVEAGLELATVQRWLSGETGAERQVQLSLPRFELSPADSLELAKPLRALGAVAAFDRASADFTDIAAPTDPQERIFISQVFHKTFVKVDEMGTEAAAATAVATGYGRGTAPPPMVMTFDRPFLFFIHDQTSGAALFMGRVADPGRS
ncbi:Serine protease inhibitor (serpin family) [Enhygromyxa salina]|uniref:Serine protease inhibitor (Serpin family) n=1 Tax=Enhygromyxa salina TaxID=215803 RepID=A0A0C2D4N7_9BACT|nr:serpin family protein [Enhygromyxa salina]KIG15047.1 Serine protease inhibitor (serpin family) [Enhygromyxa salina]